MKKEYIGIEIGGSKQQAASFDENGNLIKKYSERVKLVRGAADILDWFSGVIPDLINDRTVGLGVGFGGIIDSASGESYCSVHVDGWNKFPIKKYFEKTYSIKTTVVNDTVSGGYAELLFGAGVGVERFFYTNIGTGCGGGMFISGKSYDGLGTGAAYHGQTYVPSWDKAGEAIRMEEICSGRSIERRLRREGYVPENSMMYDICSGNVEKLSCKDWGKAIYAGDKFALSELERWAKSYSIALSSFITLLAPEKIAIGGGVSMIGEPIFEAIRRHTDELIFVSMKDKYEIVPCQTEELAVLLGSAMYARDGFKTT